MTERISAAVQGLGAEKTVKRFTERLKDVAGSASESTEPNIEVRIGAILALQRISEDSVRYDAGRDHFRVMQILCTYIRNNSPASAALDNPNGDWLHPEDPDLLLNQPEERRRNFEAWRFKSLQWCRQLSPRLDVQVALRVIATRSMEQIALESKPRAQGRSEPALDLRNTNLQGANLAFGNFQGAFFFGSRMEGANMKYANFDGAAMHGCALDFSSFADLIEVSSFIGTRFDDSTLRSVFAAGVDFRRAHFPRCDFSGSQVGRADFTGSMLSGSRFEYLVAESAKFGGTNLDGVVFSGALLAFAEFGDSSISQTRILDCDLEAVDLARCPVNRYSGGSLIPSGEGLYRPLDRTTITIQYEDPKVRKARISRDFSTCKGNERTKVPSGIERPSSWSETP